VCVTTNQPDTNSNPNSNTKLLYTVHKRLTKAIAVAPTHRERGHVPPLYKWLGMGEAHDVEEQQQTVN